MLAALFNIPRNNPSRDQFAFNNDAEHLHIIDAIRLQGGPTLERFVVNPIPSGDVPGWARRHQAMHNQMNGVLGIAGLDLTGIDFNDERGLEAWVQIHVQEHYKANLILNI